ncbi:MAG: protein kinase, partial [Arenimonas sp.]
MTTIEARLTAALADRYRLEREIGAGGMATVYLAEDLKHQRKVAIKVLRPELAAALGPDRFMQEIAIAARLQHPHILAVHDSGEADGFLYYVMPYVEGESLRERLLRQGELPVHEAVRLLLEIADALAHAHASGVVHRDIKPENVMLSGRHALVMDFGVAKAVSEASARKFATTVGVALGTPAYMAPEQATADPNLDHRADIYALGVLGYELLTGRPPFIEGSPQQILAAHLTKAPEMITVHRPGIPPALAAVIMRALAKQPADRWQTAEELVTQLEPLTTPSGGITPAATRPLSAMVPSGRLKSRYASVGLALATIAVVAILLWNRQPAPAKPMASIPTTRIATANVAVANSIAVLPFVNMSSDKEQEYFSDGLSEEVLNQLAQVPQLRVIARTSSFSFKGKEVDVATIAKILNVATILEGSVRKSGSTLRITAQLVRASDSSHLWSESYDRKLNDVFTVQDEIAGAVVGALKLKLLPAQRPSARHFVPRPEAYEQFLLGRQFANRNTQEGYDGALTAYHRAVVLEPNYAAAYAGLSLTEKSASFLTVSTDAFVQGQQRALAAAEKAIASDPTLADGYAARGAVRIEGWDWNGAQADIEKARVLNPESVSNYACMACFLASQGRLPEAIAAVRKGIELNPLAVEEWIKLARFEMAVGDFRAARQALSRGLAISPKNGSTLFYYLGLVSLLEGRPDTARAHAEGLASEPARLVLLAVAEHDLKHAAASQQALETLLAKYAKDAPYRIA